ncbi:MAG: ABC transporter ATP-binding protein [Wenzhouxiangella sp.]|nr:ABC transporter ATP-binding protein [Wenzhouxiangella sp.]TVR96620.1 MAG: ABC transporter ATP-binding protein [Wenzhouxiangellaceae bacterium]
MSSEPVVEMRAVSRHFQTGSEQVSVLDALDLSLARGERLAVMGASGSGKTTLLHLIAGMDRPSSGRIRLAGADLTELGEPALTRWRARHIGLVFQDFNLIDSLSVADNMTLPLWLNGLPEDRARVDTLAETLGIAKLLERLPASLSGGEKQRVAIARALIHNPDLILADEPTGSLDQASAERVLELFDGVLESRGATLLLVTHNRDAAELCDRRLVLNKGRLQAVK